MRITESQLRRVIRDVIKESSLSYDDGDPGDIASREYYPDMGMQQSDAGYMPDNPVDTVQQSQEALKALGRPEVPLSAEIKKQAKDLLDAIKNFVGMGEDYDVID